MRVCVIEGCGKKHFGHGYCSSHWKRWTRHGDPLGGSTPKGAVTRFIEEAALTHGDDTCLAWPFGQNSFGYGTAYYRGKLHTASRLICELAHGAPPTPKHEAAHSCGNGHQGCVTPSHLSWKTRTENQHDRFSHGTSTRAERHPMRKLGWEEVREIRANGRYASLFEIGQRYGVGYRTIGRVLDNKIWIER